MRYIFLLAALAFSAGGIKSAYAQLEPFQDFDISESVLSVTTVKVDANMIDFYLEGLKETWVAANELAKELGHLKDYRIYWSDLPESGAFNLVLVIEYENTADLGPSKARYDAFMERWGEAREEETREIAQDYPSMRAIAGEYRLRELTFK